MYFKSHYLLLYTNNYLYCNNYCRRLFVSRRRSGVLPYKGWLVTASQLDLPSLTPFSVTGYGRLQLRVADWATSVALLQVANH